MEGRFFDFEKVNNEFVKTLQLPKWNATLKAIATKKAVLLVTHSVSLPSIEFSRDFILCHVAFRNPKKTNELVSMNGTILISENVSQEVRELISISSPAAITGDPLQIFDSVQYRDLVAKYTQSSSPASYVKNKVQILREGEILFTLGPSQKQLVPIILISQPIVFEGCTWTQEELAKQSPNTGQKSEQPGFLDSWFGNSSPQLSVGPTPKTKKKDQTTRQNATSYKDLFWVKLKDPAASALAQRLRNFIPDFLKSPPKATEQGKIVHTFIQNMLEDMRSLDLWKDASHEELDEVGYDCLEKYIMVKIYSLCFAPTPEDLQKDKALSQKIKQLSWVTPDHLEIRSFHRNTSRFSTAVTELRKMDIYKAPKDKMICLLNTCKSLYYILNKASAQGHPAGADEFLPLLIYTVIRANPPRLVSNMTFIQEFRRPTSQITETGYYLTHLISTTMFVETVEHSQLNVTEEEFDRLMASNGEGSNSTISSPFKPTLGDSGDADPDGVRSPREGSIDREGREGSARRLGHLSPSTPTSRGSRSITSPPTSRGEWSRDSYYASESDDFEGLSLSRNKEENPVRDDRAFYHQVQTDLDRRRFLNCNPQDLRIGDIPTLLQMFCELVNENQMLREELDRK